MADVSKQLQSAVAEISVTMANHNSHSAVEFPWELVSDISVSATPTVVDNHNSTSKPAVNINCNGKKHCKVK
ncbi:MAG: hypothetical protein IPJ26_17425 [Bacteroidetes bacterium]|nr:hypothetical protein [Bacteroidota bacterium]